MSSPPISRIDAADPSPPGPVRSSHAVRAGAIQAIAASTSQDFPIGANDFASGSHNHTPGSDTPAEAPSPLVGSAGLEPTLAASAHGEELVARLTGMIHQVDRREAQLNSRIAIHEHRERMFRIQVNDWRAAQAQAESDLERRRHELQLQARRIAFQDHAVSENANADRPQ